MTLKFNFDELKANGVKRIGELNPYITLACDLRCSYCYMFNFLTKAKDQTEIMQPEYLLAMINELARDGNSLDRMTFLGGEPTLHPNITEICNEAAQFPIKEMRMTTNGIGTHCLDLDKLEPGIFDHISISVDGIDAETNDATRGKNAFKKIIETIGLYKQAGISVSVNYTVTSHNLNNLNETVPFFKEIGVSIINFHRASMDGNAYNNKNILVNACEWVAARDQFFEYLKKEGGKYPDLKIRVPYIFLTQNQINWLGYRPIQVNNYHSPKGGHRLIIFPPTMKGKGLCYMSSDMIGHPNSELGHLDQNGKFTWNTHIDNEMTAFKHLKSSNVSTDIKGQDEGIGGSSLLRVSHSFKAVIYTNKIDDFMPISHVEIGGYRRLTHQPVLEAAVRNALTGGKVPLTGS